MLLLDIVFLEMNQKRAPPLEQLVLATKDIVVKIGLVGMMADIALMVDSQMLLETMGLFGFVVVIAMDIALIVDSQVLLEIMELFVQMAGLQLFVEEMGLVVPMAGHQLFVEEMDLVVPMVGLQLFVEEMDLVVALDR